MREKESRQSIQKIQTRTRVERGKSGITHIIFGRTGVIILLLLLQLGIIFGSYTYFAGKMYFIDSILRILAVFLIIYLVNCRANPAIKMVWMMIIMLFPVFGTLMYLFVETQISVKWINARLQNMHLMTGRYWFQNKEVHEKLKQEDEETAALAHYVCQFGGFPAYENTSVKYFSCGEDKIEELVCQLEMAEKFIFMEYFIVAKGYVWDRILSVLKKKAKEGVEVRFMYDGTCTVSLLPPNYSRKLAKEGIQCRVFSPIKPALSTHQNNRDHRKVVVIDGRVAFTGGINLADEYVNRKIRFGHWKDTAIMLEGDAVRSFTLMFLEMWNVAKNVKVENFDPYLDAEYTREPQEGDGFVIPYGDSPVDAERVGEMVYMDILNTAKRYVHIMTPYLILDNEMITALQFAAKKGVEVIIIMPHVPDKWYAFVLAKTYYNELLDAGVQIYEYTPGFVHAKVFTSDDDRAVVGTINMDYRSLYLHFECAAFMYKNREIENIEKDFQETLKKCQKITQEDFKRQKTFNKLAGYVLRVLAPLM